MTLEATTTVTREHHQAIGRTIQDYTQQLNASDTRAIVDLHSGNAVMFQPGHRRHWERSSSPPHTSEHSAASSAASPATSMRSSPTATSPRSARTGQEPSPCWPTARSCRKSAASCGS